MCEVGYNQDRKRHFQKNSSTELWTVTLKPLTRSCQPFTNWLSSRNLRSATLLVRSTATMYWSQPSSSLAVSHTISLQSPSPASANPDSTLLCCATWTHHSCPLTHPPSHNSKLRPSSPLCSSYFVAQLYCSCLRSQQPPLLLQFWPFTWHS